MKYIILKPIVLLIITIFISSCEKDLFKKYENPLAVVEFKKIIATEEGSVIYANILDAGKGYVKYYGFCYSEDSVPILTDNQILLNDIQTGEFSSVINNVFPDSVYYFMAFVANEYGYTVSNIEKIKIPVPENINVPCDISNNTIINDGVSYSCNVSDSESNYYTLSASCYYSGGPTVTMYFKNKPLTGIYFTTGSENISEYNSNEVKVNINDSFNGYYYIYEGSKVYVINQNDSLIVSFCNLKYSSEDKILKGKIIN